MYTFLLVILLFYGQMGNMEACFAKPETREMMYSRFIDSIRKKNLPEATDILKKLYDNNVEHTLEIMEFMRHNIISLENLILAYSILYEEMHPRKIYDKGWITKHLEKNHALLFRGRVKEVFHMKNYRNINETYKEKLRGISRDLENPTRVVIKTWKAHIIKNNYTHILDLANEFYMPVRMILKDLITFAFQPDKIVIKKLIIFSRGLPYIEQCMVAYDTIYDMMKSHNYVYVPQILMLAYGIKESIDMQKYEKLSDEDKSMFQYLNSDLPEGVQNFTYSDIFCIQNLGTGKFLSVRPEIEAHFKQRRNVRMSDQCSMWRVVPYHFGEMFLIKSVEYNEEYLYPSRDRMTLDDGRRRVFTFLGSEKAVIGGEWFLEPYQHAKEFLIRSVMHNEYLYDDPLHIHKVYTYRGKGVKPKNLSWKLIPQVIEYENGLSVEK